MLSNKYKLILICLISYLLNGCEEKNLNKIIIPLRSEINHLDPHLSYDLISNMVSYQVYETLYQYHYLKRPYFIVPLLAEEMPIVSTDGLKYLIKIKKNIKYHPHPILPKDRQVMAQDFVTSFKRLALKNTKSKGWSLFRSKFIGLDEFREKTESIDQLLKNSIEGINAKSSHVLEIKLKSFYSTSHILNLLSMVFTSPIPEEILKDSNFDFNKHTVGTGPFIIKEFDSESGVLLKSNINYSSSNYPTSGDRTANINLHLKDAGKKLPFIELLEMPVVKNDMKRWEQLLNNQINISNIPRKIITEVLDLKGNIKNKYSKIFNLYSAPSLTLWWIGINMQDPILGKNLYLRKALASAINYDEFMQKFTSNADQKVNSIYPPGILGHSPSKDLPYQYNKELAIKYLEKAGFPNGKGLPTFEFNTRREDQKDIEMAKFFQSQWTSIGIKVKIAVNSFGTFLEKAKKRKMQLWHSGWLLDYPDAENILQLLYSKNIADGTNKTGFSNSTFDQYYQQIISQDRYSPELTPLLNSVEELVHQELPWIMLYYSKNYIAYAKYIQNFRYSELIMNFPKYLRVK